MAASSQVSKGKRGREGYWNAGLGLPDGKRTNSGTFSHDIYLSAILDKIDDMDYSKDEIRLNGDIKPLEDDIELTVQTNKNNESADGKPNTDQMCSNYKEDQFNAERESDPTSLMSDIGYFTYYDDARAKLDFFVEHISPCEFGIMQSYLDGDSVTNNLYSDAVHAYVEGTDVSYGLLWEDDIWQLNENPVIQNDFASPQQQEFGINGAEFHDVWS